MNAPPASQRRILGIDPGANATGWAALDVHGARLRFVEAGVIRAQRGAGRPQRLAAIHAALLDILDRLAPDEAAVEETFVNASPRDALVLGEARGVALAAPAGRGLPVAEYAANTIKKSVVGQGHADKKQVAMMVRVLCPAAGALAGDAADALAVAICHAHHAPADMLARARRSA
ncbi:MAG: crossover junction endodeoxyribonuclease RuvC [Alphaproteobacteria bacterium]|nr:crossover junction endodeoxyribonuclease RuvC [Alphaproteobacteria bacterium]